MDKEKIIARFKEEISEAGTTDLSDEEKYRSFVERVGKEISLEMEGLDRLQLRSLAKAHAKVFG